MAMNDPHVRAIHYPIPKALVATRALTSLPKNLQKAFELRVGGNRIWAADRGESATTRNHPGRWRVSRDRCYVEAGSVWAAMQSDQQRNRSRE